MLRPFNLPLRLDDGQIGRKTGQLTRTGDSAHWRCDRNGGFFSQQYASIDSV